MFSKTVALISLLALPLFSIGQPKEVNKRIDSLLNAETSTPFHGIVLVSTNGETKYSNYFGIADYDKISFYEADDQFVIGSISKQITAVLLLREYDKGRIQLHVPIRKYLPELKMSWADSVTIHHLLTHTHGINELDQPLAFPAGSRFQYSQIGYALLADIIEKVTGKSFAVVSVELFHHCKMHNTTHPGLHQYKRLLHGYSENAFGNIITEGNSFENYVPAGRFVSTAGDLVIWNEHLHHGKLLSDTTYQLMIKKYATREHPIFGPTQYGYGISVGEPDGIKQLGQTGFAPGFISMNFYFPETKTSLIVLDNMVWDQDNIKNAFYYHVKILTMVRGSLKK